MDKGRTYLQSPRYSVTQGGKVYDKLYRKYVHAFLSGRSRALYVRLYYPGRGVKQIALARVIASVYCPRAPDTIAVIPKDGNVLHVHYTNLQWVRHSDTYNRTKHNQAV